MIVFISARSKWMWIPKGSIDLTNSTQAQILSTNEQISAIQKPLNEQSNFPAYHRLLIDQVLSTKGSR